MKLIFNDATATDNAYTNVDNGFAQILKQGLIEYSFPSGDIRNSELTRKV